MIEFNGSVILLDVEGTTSSVAFVTDVLFPYARRELNVFLRNHWAEAEVQMAINQICRDAGAEDYEEWSGGPGMPPEHSFIALRSEVIRLMEADAKTTGLKALQGLIWQQGYKSGQLRSHVYPDVVPALAAWTAAGKRVAIYSSGSVLAQKLFFAHTVVGDLTPLFSAYFDTTTGPKKEASSYEKIARKLEVLPQAVLFLSDVPAELDAAKSAGMQVGLVIRDAASMSLQGHPALASFAHLELK